MCTDVCRKKKNIKKFDVNKIESVEKWKYPSKQRRNSKNDFKLKNQNICSIWRERTESLLINWLNQMSFVECVSKSEKYTEINSNTQKNDKKFVIKNFVFFFSSSRDDILRIWMAENENVTKYSKFYLNMKHPYNLTCNFTYAQPFIFRERCVL